MGASLASQWIATRSTICGGWVMVVKEDGGYGGAQLMRTRWRCGQTGEMKSRAFSVEMG